MNEVAITGCTGFVGLNLIDYLKGYANVRCINLRRGDNVAPEQTGTIVHLAGKAHDLRKSVDPDEYFHVNFDLTKKLYQSFLESKAKKFIFISSVKAVADKVEVVLTEDMEPDPRTHYGKSKLMAENFIINQPLPVGKSFYILRPCMIHGPGNKGNLNLLYSLIAKGIPYPLASFENKRSFLSIENLCFVIKELIEREDIPPGTYNVADDISISTNELITIIGKGIGQKSSLWRVNPGFIKLLALLGDKLGLPLNSERLDKLTENYVVSNAKLKSALARDLPVSVTEGILSTIGSFRTQNN